MSGHLLGEGIEKSKDYRILGNNNGSNNGLEGMDCKVLEKKTWKKKWG